MKNIFTFLALSLTIFCFGQFKITPENFKSIDSPDKDYIVYEFPGKTKSDLFNAAKMYVNSTYKGVKFDGYNEVANEQIVLDVNYVKPNAGMFDGAGLFSVSNRYEMNFKDGKIMFRPSFRYLQDIKGNKIYLSGGSFLDKTVYNKNGKLSVSSKLEELINKSVEGVSSGLNKSIQESKSNDW